MINESDVAVTPPSTTARQHGIVINVQRSMSLQQPSVRRPTVMDRNNNAGIVNTATSNASLFSSGAEPRNANDRQFELANVLARAATLDAKFERQMNDYVSSASQYDVRSASSNDFAFVDSSGIRQSSRFVQLPERYQTVRRTSFSHRRSSTTSTCSGVSLGLMDCSSPGTGSFGIGTVLNTVPEGRANSDCATSEEHAQSECRLMIRRYDDALAALKWLRQEIGELKQQDRVIMRTLLELGTKIHQLNGGLHETVSCLVVATPTLDSSTFNVSHYDQSSTPLHQTTSDRMVPTSMDPCTRTVSMLEIPQNKSPSKTGSSSAETRQRSSPGARFLSLLGLRGSSSRSADQIME